MEMVLKELVWFAPLVVVGVAALLAVRLLLPRTWAVARQTLAEALRMKIAFFFGALMVLGFWAAATSQGDGTVSGRIQSFLVYALMAASFLLSLLSIFLSRSLSEEVVHHQILMLMAKPIPRWQYLLGKWLGVVLLDAVLLALIGAGTYGTVRYLAAQPPLNEYDAGRLEHEVLTARHATPFVIPTDLFWEEANRMYDENLAEGLYDHIDNLKPDEIKKGLYAKVEARWRNVPVAQYRDFVFKGVLCDRKPTSYVQLRYKAQANRYPPDEVLRTQWVAGDPNGTTEVYAQGRADVVGRFHTIPFPADAVTKDGTLTVRFINFNPDEDRPQFNNMLFFEGPRGVEALFKVGTFGGNLLRALLLVLCRLMFLTAVALLFATIFSFPVACLCSFTVYVLASIRQYLGDALEYLKDAGEAVAVFKTAFSWLLKFLYLLVPNFARYDAVELLADGRNVTLAWVLQSMLYMMVIGTGLALLIGCLLLYRREVSETSI